jgi:hypothetical protein
LAFFSFFFLFSGHCHNVVSPLLFFPLYPFPFFSHLLFAGVSPPIQISFCRFPFFSFFLPGRSYSIHSTLPRCTGHISICIATHHSFLPAFLAV